MVSAPRRLKSISILPTAPTASTCSQPPASRAKADACSIGWMTPVSLLASMTQTSAWPGRLSASANQPRSAWPSASTGQISTDSPAAWALSATAACSVAPSRMRS